MIEIRLTWSQWLQSVGLDEDPRDERRVAVVDFLLKRQLRPLNVLAVKEAEVLGTAVASLRRRKSGGRSRLSLSLSPGPVHQRQTSSRRLSSAFTCYSRLLTSLVI